MREDHMSYILGGTEAVVNKIDDQKMRITFTIIEWMGKNKTTMDELIKGSEIDAEEFKKLIRGEDYKIDTLLKIYNYMGMNSINLDVE